MYMPGRYCMGYHQAIGQHYDANNQYHWGKYNPGCYRVLDHRGSLDRYAMDGRYLMGSIEKLGGKSRYGNGF
jgi:hypothetical protein